MSQKINQNAALTMFEFAANVLIKDNPNQSYAMTDNMEDATTMIVSHYKLNRNHLQDLLVLREKFEKRMDKEYKIKRSQGMMAVTQDMDALLKLKRVPQKLQVMNGLMDSVIGFVYIAKDTAE